MKRILFVDDEQHILDGLQNLLRRQRAEMDMVFALGGEAALAEMQKAPADVIVSDMRMPGMDGAALLRRVKEEHPGTVRIILSGHSEREAVFSSLHVAHQILSKPCSADKLLNVLTRACQLRALLDDDSMGTALGGLADIPSLPAAYWDLMKAVSDPNSTIHAIAGIVETDSAMCTKILQIVNSACFGTVEEITSIDRAVSYLGLDLIKSLTLSVNVFRAIEDTPTFPGFSIEIVQSHALLTARVIRTLFPQQSATAFTAALLHDVGCGVLACCDAEKFREALETQGRTHRSVCEIETSILGLTHAAAGAYLLGLWGLPLSLVEAVAYHHDPRGANEMTFDLPSALAVADTLVSQAIDGESTAPFTVELEEHLRNLGVLSQFPQWRDVAMREIDTWSGRN